MLALGRNAANYVIKGLRRPKSDPVQPAVDTNDEWRSRGLPLLGAEVAWLAERSLWIDGKKRLPSPFSSSSDREVGVMTRPIKITEGSGNVFKDIGVPDPEGALAKAELARQIAMAIAKRHLTQVQAARLLDVDQPKVSALLNGRLQGFSTERLFRFLTLLGRSVRIMVGTRQAKNPKITVRCA